ncbi:polysaccharide biosynthesis tyrosine autokinase [Pusillimonas sp.]|uniref:polysaccharide biosynthesis tyrosine autokinase n=1 Tax=Pusillimonas sp. TaxID=3040095 RepID=UPI0029B167FC|nr:polysaccharide biosynthesis tyrosine autokinase [Pusillimonas sp.]MDX3895632.1 polysaccharide biosynthesis tyrosine autokinase [Pusillimonas sp.]
MNPSTQDMPPSLADQQDRDEMDLLGLLDVVIEARWLIAAITAAVLFFGILYAFLSQPVYQADSLIQVEQNDPTTANALSEMAALFNVQSPASAEIEILRSRLVVGQAVDNLRLHLNARPDYLPLIGRWLASRSSSLSNPGFPGLKGYVWGTETILLDRLDMPDELEGTSLYVIATADGYSLQGPDEKFLAEGKVGELLPFELQGEPARIRIAELRAKPGARFIVSRQSRISMIKNLQGSLEISEKGKQSGVLSAVLAGTDPKRITRILNAIGQAYVEQNIQRKAAEAEKSLDFLDDFLPELKAKMDEAADRYTAFRDEHGTFDLGTEGSLSLNTSVELQSQLFALEQKRRELASLYTAEHPTLQVVDRQIAAVKKEIEELSRKISALPDLEQRLLTLMQDVKVNGELYVNLLNSAQQLRLVKEGKIGNVRVVDQAVEPSRPIKPNKPLVLSVALLLGLILGVGAAFLRNMMRPGIKDPADIETTLGLNVFATVPHTTRQTDLHRLITSRQSGNHVLASASPGDPAVESLRSLRTALQFAMLDAPNNIVLFSGPTPGIGKSFTSVNFAAVLGAAGKRVLLVDADLRKGYVHQYFGQERAHGLSELISGAISAEQAIRREVLPNVDLIATGLLPPNPAELLLSPAAPKALEALAGRYDIVLLDTTPILAVSDAMALASHAGAVFLLARAEVTTLGELEESAKRLRQSGARINGVIFNDLSATSRRYGSKYGSYRYTQYEYGSKDG